MFFEALLSCSLNRSLDACLEFGGAVRHGAACNALSSKGSDISGSFAYCSCSEGISLSIPSSARHGRIFIVIVALNTLCSCKGKRGSTLVGNAFKLSLGSVNDSRNNLSVCKNRGGEVSSVFCILNVISGGILNASRNAESCGKGVGSGFKCNLVCTLKCVVNCFKKIGNTYGAACFKLCVGSFSAFKGDSGDLGLSLTYFSRASPCLYQEPAGMGEYLS